jgi:2-dehydropantoate 2-reductase
MRIAIMATGGVGGYFGARLCAAGHEVHFVARGAHLKALRDDGLKVESQLGNLHLTNLSVTDDPSDIGPVEAVMFAVKLWDLEQAAEACKPLLGSDTVVIPFLNGVSSMDILTEYLGAEHVAGGVAQIAATIGAPGVIHHNSPFAKLFIGERNGNHSSRMDKLVTAFGDAGFEHEISDDITRTIWEKFVFLSALSGLTALCRKSIGPIRNDPDTRALFESAVKETAAIGRAEGVDLGEDLESSTMAFVDTLPDNMKSSMLHDLEGGRRLELPWLSGSVVRLGHSRGVDTPVHSTVYGALKFYSNGT